MTTSNEERLVEADLQRRYAALVGSTTLEPHPSEDDWVCFADGALDETARLRLADHVASCARCSDVFRAVVHVRSGAPALGALVSPAAAGRSGDVSRVWYGLALAATLMLAVAGAVWSTGRAGTPATPRPVASSAPPAIPAAPPAPAVPAGPRAWAALATAPAISLPASLAIVTRGTSSPAEAFMTAFGGAMVPYREGRYAEAAAALDGVTRRQTDVAEGWFYLGASRLWAGDAAGALAPLERARASTVLAVEARWLGVVALERAGRRLEADAALAAMCRDDPANRERACAAAAVKP